MCWEIKPIEYKLCVDWAISRSTYQHKTNYLIYINDKVFGEFAPNIRFNEEHEKVINQINTIVPKLCQFSNESQVLTLCDMEREIAHLLSHLLPESKWLSKFL